MMQAHAHQRRVRTISSPQRKQSSELQKTTQSMNSDTDGVNS